MEELHNSNTSEDINMDNLMGFSKESMNDIFEQINTEKNQKNVNIQSVPQIIQIPNNDYVPQNVPDQFQVKQQSILKHTMQPVHIQPQPVHIQPQPVQIQPQPVQIQPQPVHIQPQPVHIQPQPVQIQPQHLKIMNFEISKTTMYFAIGLLISIVLYYYIHNKNNKQKENNNNKIRRGRYNDQIEQYNE